MPISQKTSPLLYRAAVTRHRLKRSFSLYASLKKYASVRTALPLSHKVTSHKSVLMRKLGDADMRLQRNKITNLGLAAKEINTVLIRPGETFSLWRLVGNPTKRRGFLPGMLLSSGEIVEGIGGGLCQLANLLYWMALHTPLTVVERYRHSFDAFPDSGRVLPFGSGATIFYNYIDLQFRNDTDATFEVQVRLDDTFIHGTIRADREIPHTYSVIERDHRFTLDSKTGTHFRENKIFRETRSRSTGQTLKEELVCENHSKMKYKPPLDAEVIVV